MNQRLFTFGRILPVLAISFLLVGLPAFAQQEPETSPPPLEESLQEPPTILPAPPGSVSVTDQDTKTECTITLDWTLSTDDGSGQNNVTGYRILRKSGNEGAFEQIDETIPGANSYKDTECDFNTSYQYKLAAMAGDAVSEFTVTTAIEPHKVWVDWSKANIFIIGLIIAASIIYFISHVKAGKKLFIRKIAGLEAVDEAIGRATEMGRPILFIPGILDMNDVQTVSSVIILGRIAKTIAEYDTRLYVPTSKSLVMTTARETVKEAYLSAGRPDAYNDDMITYLTDEQFGYVAGVNGIMVREKPATCFYLGAFFAESLILAETGNSIGAIQVAGTAMPSQLPFFIAACDYTLIGEELFAASAYLSHEPKQLGSLKGQDVGKAIAMVAIAIGSVLSTLNVVMDVAFIQTATDWFQNLFSIQ